MKIIYEEGTGKLTEENAERLFLALDWESGKHPERLYEALRQSHTVMTAWDGEKLVGLANALSDGIMTAYFHYVLTDPAYQGNGIGKKLMGMMLEKYKDIHTKVLVSYPKAVGFYKSLGFEEEKESMPMYLYTK